MIPKGIERIFMKKIIGVILLSLLCVGIFACLPSYAKELAWNEIWDPNMVDLVGSDGQKYYTPKDYWVAYYDQDGNCTYRKTDGGVLQKKLRIVCYDNTVQTVYCIGAGLAYQYGGDKYYKEDLNVPNDYFEQLPDAAKEGIYLTLLFGYEDGRSSPVPGTNEDDYWLATQALIWEYQQGLRQGGEDLQDNGPIRRDVYFEMVHNRPAEFCYEWIRSQIRNYLIFPSFLTVESPLYREHNVLVQQEKDGVYTLDLYDDNHTEAALSVQNSQGEVLDQIEIIHLGGSDYRLQTTLPLDGTVPVWVRKEVPHGYRQLTYFSDGSGKTQVVVCRSAQSAPPKMAVPLTLSTQDYVEEGNIQITKYAEKGSLAYAFQVQGLDAANAHICEVVYTNQAGQGALERLPVGMYEVKELLSEDSPWQQPEATRIEVQNGMTSEVVFHNILKKGSLTIYKSFEGRDTSWPGIQFEVTGIYQGEHVYQNTVTMDQDGNCVLTNLPIGQYVVRELQGDHMQWYALSEPCNVEILENQTTQVCIQNNARKTQLTIDKVGPVIHTGAEDNGIVLPITQIESLTTAVFEVYAQEDICAEDGTLRIAKGTLVDTITWDGAQYRSCLLYPGVYRIRESVCPAGYQSGADQVVVLCLDQDNTIRIENQLMPQTVSFEKKLEDGRSEPLNQIFFGLYAGADFLLPDGTIVYQNSLLDAATVQENGLVCLSTLFNGPLYVKEIATAPGYVLDTTLYPVSNGIINEGKPLINSLVPVNPRTGERRGNWIYAGVFALLVCAGGIIAFYRKSRYNI